MNKKILLWGLSAILIIQSYSFSNDNDYRILQPDNSIGRKTKVLANKVVVRIKQEYSNIYSAESIIKKFDKNVTIDNSFLKPSQSVTFNSKIREKTKSKPNLSLSNIIKAEEPLLRTYKVKYEGDKSPEDYCKELLANLPAIEIAEPIFLPELQQFYPNDPMAVNQTLLSTCKLFDAWGIEQGDTNVVIGISDNGMYQQHHDLTNSIARNWADPVNGIDDDGNGFIDDFAGYDLTGQNQPPDNTFNPDDHGTNVAGIAAATVNNEIGMAGTAFKCRIFPIKIAIGNKVVVPYESIMFAAHKGFKVLNCSWGVVKPFSAIDQSIINYAVAHDVAIVSSGGNDMGSLENNYPSAYDGVLAVGEVSQSDIFSGNNIGAYLDVLAPGKGNWYTKNNHEYGNFFGGSSYSAPVVTGIVALIRSKYSQLTALQAIELARQSVDDVSHLPGNVFWKDILPGRINAYKAVTTDPFSIPSIRPRNITYRTTEGIESSRFAVGDTILLSVDAFNYLGDASNLTFALSPAWDDNESIEIIDSSVFLPLVQKESSAVIGEFKFVIKKENREKMFFRCDIYGTNNYHDFFLIEFIPSPIVTTFKNDVIAFSVSDRGTIGFGGAENSKQGIGFTYKELGNQIWRANFIASESEGRLVTSLNWDKSTGDKNDFNFVKAFVPPNNNIGIFNDNNALSFQKLGIEVKQEFILPQGDYPIAKVNIEITNTGVEDLDDFTSGYYFDWDIDDSDSNSVELLQEAIPEGINENQAATEIVYSTNQHYPVFGNSVITYETNAQVQMAGFSVASYDIYNETKRRNVMNSGTDIQMFGVFDAALFAGMKYPGTFSPGQTRRYSICFGGTETKEEFISKMKIALDSTYTPVSENIEQKFFVKVYPQPAEDFLFLQIETFSNMKLDISILDLLGREVYNSSKDLYGMSIINMPINISDLATGTYMLKVSSNNNYHTEPIKVIK